MATVAKPTIMSAKTVAPTVKAAAKTAAVTKLAQSVAIMRAASKRARGRSRMGKGFLSA
jgi:hypothetical protein